MNILLVKNIIICLDVNFDCYTKPLSVGQIVLVFLFLQKKTLNINCMLNY